MGDESEWVPRLNECVLLKINDCVLPISTIVSWPKRLWAERNNCVSVKKQRNFDKHIIVSVGTQSLKLQAQNHWFLTAHIHWTFLAYLRTADEWQLLLPKNWPKQQGFWCQWQQNFGGVQKLVKPGGNLLPMAWQQKLAALGYAYLALIQHPLYGKGILMSTRLFRSAHNHFDRHTIISVGTQSFRSAHNHWSCEHTITYFWQHTFIEPWHSFITTRRLTRVNARNTRPKSMENSSVHATVMTFQKFFYCRAHGEEHGRDKV